MGTIIFIVCLMSPLEWIQSHSPPDSIAFEEVFLESPVETVLFMARTSWIPEWFSEEDVTAVLLRAYSVVPQTAVFCARLLNHPCSFASVALQIEYSYESDVNLDNPTQLEAGLRCVLHDIAYGIETEIADEFKRAVVRNWCFLSKSVQQLVLEVFGKTETDILGVPMLSFEELSYAGNASMARYFSEIEYEHYRFPNEAGLNTLERVYAARCCPKEDLQDFLSDSSWAVRYSAVQRCDPALL